MMRKRVWIDRTVQGVLAFRLILYWFMCIAYFGAGTVSYQLLEHTEWSTEEHLWALADTSWYWVPGLFLLLPLIVFDIIRLSHRFAGPVYRLNWYLGRVHSGEEKGPLWFREDDYWGEIVEPVNELVRKYLTATDNYAETSKRLNFAEKALAETEAELAKYKEAALSFNESQKLNGSATTSPGAPIDNSEWSTLTAAAAAANIPT